MKKRYTKFRNMRQEMQKSKIFGFGSYILLLLILLSHFSMEGFNRSRKKVESHQYGDSLHLLDSLVNIYKVKDNKLSLSYARKSLVIAKRINSPESLIKAYSLISSVFNQNAKDSSYYFLTKALKIIDQYNVPNQRPRIIYDIALLYNVVFNYRTAIILLDSSAKLSEQNQDYRLLSLTYCALGNIKYQTNDSSGARQMYQFAFNVAKEHSLYHEMGNAYGNLGKFEKDSNKFVKIQKTAIRWLMINPGNEREIATLITNIGFICSNPDSAISYYVSALNMIKHTDDYDLEMGIYNNMAYSYLSKNDIIRAEQCLTNFAIPIAMKEDNKDWLSTLYDSYADVLKEQGKFKEEAESRKQSMEYRSEADLKTGSEQVRLLSSLLDLQNKDKEILVQHNSIK